MSERKRAEAELLDCLRRAWDLAPADDDIRLPGVQAVDDVAFAFQAPPGVPLASTHAVYWIARSDYVAHVDGPSPRLFTFVVNVVAGTEDLREDMVARADQLIAEWDRCGYACNYGVEGDVGREGVAEGPNSILLTVSI